MENKNLLKELVDTVESLRKTVPQNNGYILIPTYDGFQVYEISTDRLIKYLEIESLYKKNNK